MAVNVKVCLLGWGVSRSGWAASTSARTRAAAVRQSSSGRRQWEEKTHGDQGVQHLPVGGGTDHSRRPVVGEGQLVEAPDDLVAWAAAAPLVSSAPGVQQHPVRHEHPPRLVQRPFPVGDQVQHVDLEHGVDAGVAERQPAGVGPQHGRWRQPGGGRLGPEAVQHRQRQVDPDDLAATAVQGQGDPAGADTDLQQAGRRPDRLLDPVGDQLGDLGPEPAALVVEPGRPVEGDAHMTALRRSHRSTATPSPVACTSTQFTG
jgi:hypothetical protein